uniref:Uncharacterized protein n=1 Tax=uncultured Gemmatimonadales bacterium HF0770_41L09 TaxID=723617 RepID=E7C7W7_9BACT|nr:hypothetical protein [uncultured Gemmatimonadales bacterium HF0770_41L09]
MVLNYLSNVLSIPMLARKHNDPFLPMIMYEWQKSSVPENE